MDANVERSEPSLPANGEPPSLQLLFRTHYGPMVRLARLLVGSPTVAEDLVQDVFVRMLHAPAADVPGAYLRVSVVNACHSWHRRRGREERALPHLVTRPDESSPARELDDALATLPFRRRAVLVLRYYADLPDDEIAALLGCRRATVRSIARRALRDLRAQLEEEPS